MPDDEAAKAAIAALHESEIEGRKIVVNESAPRPEGERKERSFKPRSGGFGGGNRGGGGYGGGNRGGYNRGEGGGGYNRY
jgi:RNA recognition motif-containing protein